MTTNSQIDYWIACLDSLVFILPDLELPEEFKKVKKYEHNNASLLLLLVQN